MNKKSDEQSKKYSNLFPSASVGYNDGDLSMSLSYRNTTVRPGYGQLRSSITYFNPYTYEGGNPSLRPSFVN